MLYASSPWLERLAVHMVVAPALQAAVNQTPVLEVVIGTPASVLAAARKWENLGWMCRMGWLHLSCSIPRRVLVRLSRAVVIAKEHWSWMSSKMNARMCSDPCGRHHPMMWRLQKP